MHFATKTSILLVGAIGLAGCDGPLEPFAFDTTYTTFAEINTAFAGDVAANVDPDGDLINPANIAEKADFGSVSSGTATYNGAVIAEEISGDGVLIGQLQLAANFNTSRIDGRAGNFIHSDDGVILGTLLGTSSDFTSDETTNSFTLDLVGTLDNAGTLLDVTLALDGNFLNAPGDVSDVAGDADIAIDGADTYEGAFSAAR